MYSIPDDPIISSIMRTGYPPWVSEYEDEYDEWEEEYDDEEVES